MTENRRIFWNVAATFGRSLYGLVLGLLCGRWALMALGEVDYGLYGLVGGLTVFISFFNSVLSGANARFYAYSVGAAKVAVDKNAALEDCRRWFNTALSVHTVVPFILIVLGYPVGVYAVEHWLTIPPERMEACIWVFRFVCISCFIGMVNVPFNAMYCAKQYIAELTIYSFVTSTLNLVMLYFMVTHPGDWLTRYVLWSCALVVVPQIIICLRAMKIFPECRVRIVYMWDKAKLRELGAYSGWQMLGNVCGLLRTNGITIVVNKFFGARMNAAQAIGNTVQAQCNTLASAMQGALTPVIVQACGARDYKKMTDFAMRTCKFNIVLFAVFAIPLALECSEVMRIWLKNPPPYATGLCLCAMFYHLIGCCTVGHMIVVNAIGNVRPYYIAMSLVNVFTLPLAVLVGSFWRNVYCIMSAVIFMEVLNSIGRVFFARYLAQMSVWIWIQKVMLPAALVCGLSLCAGFIPRIILEESFQRICLTTLICECIFLPLAWLVLLSQDERSFIREKFIQICERSLRQTKRQCSAVEMKSLEL